MEVTTLLTYEVFHAFYQLTLFKGRNPKGQRLVFIVILPLVSLGIVIMNIFRPGMVLGYIFGGIGLLMFAGFIYLLGPGSKKQYASLPEQMKAPQHYIFDDEAITACCEYQDAHYKNRYAYDKIAVQETADTLYIYIAANQAMILPKSDMGDHLSPITSLLKEKLSSKQYVVSRKKKKA